MVGWVARGLLIVAGFVASWFVAKDTPQFGLVQMAVGLILFVFVIWVLAFWPERWRIYVRAVASTTTLLNPISNTCFPKSGVAHRFAKGY